MGTKEDFVFFSTSRTSEEATREHAKQSEAALCACLSLCVSVRVSTCICACVGKCVGVCRCKSKYIYIYICIYMYTYIHGHIRVYVCCHIGTRVCVHAIGHRIFRYVRHTGHAQLLRTTCVKKNLELEASILRSKKLSSETHPSFCRVNLTRQLLDHLAAWAF